MLNNRIHSFAGNNTVIGNHTCVGRNNVCALRATHLSKCGSGTDNGIKLAARKLCKERKRRSKAPLICKNKSEKEGGVSARRIKELGGGLGKSVLEGALLYVKTSL